MRATYKMIRQIERLAGREVSAKRVRRALELVEAHCPIGALMADVATEPFKPTMLEAAKGCPEEEEGLAWLTLAAAGPVKTWRALAGRAADLLGPEAIGAVLDADDRRGACVRRAEAARSEEEWGAWLLVSRLRRRELVKAIGSDPRQPTPQGEGGIRLGAINPEISEQLAALGLV